MRTIYKTVLSSDNQVVNRGARALCFDVPMSVDARVLSTAGQHGEIAVWYETNPENDQMSRRFRVVPTGDSIDGGEYLGTVLLSEGRFVFHVYDLGEAL